MSIDVLRVGTRGSALAIAQANSVIQRLSDWTQARFLIMPIKTTGDQLDDAKPKQLGSGIFEKEVDEALLSGKVDMAIHSMKDVPTTIPDLLLLASVPERLPPNDVFLSQAYPSIKSMPAGSCVGTGSSRRVAQINTIRRDLTISPLRGNVDTRIRRLIEGRYDGIIIAEAGILRLSLSANYIERLPIEILPTSPGQGALAVITRREDTKTSSIVARINCPEAMEEVRAEREFLRSLGCGCSAPLGCTAKASPDSLKMICGLYSKDGFQSKIFEFIFPRGSPDIAGMEAAERVINDPDVQRFWRL